MERYLEAHNPDCVVLEKVERNITSYLNTPPILTAPTAEFPMVYTMANTDTSLQAASCASDANYYMFCGTVDPARMHTDSRILVSIDGVAYEAYQTGSGNDFCLYLKKDAFTGTSAAAEVYVVHDDAYLQALSATIDLPQA